MREGGVADSKCNVFFFFFFSFEGRGEVVEEAGRLMGAVWDSGGVYHPGPDHHRSRGRGPRSRGMAYAGLGGHYSGGGRTGGDSHFAYGGLRQGY